MNITPALPRAPGALPLLGHTLTLLRRPLEFLRSLPAHGDVVQVRLGPARAVAVCTAELTQQVMRDDRTFDKGGLLYDRTRDVIGAGLAASPHTQHRRKRRLVQPAFQPALMPGYAQLMTARITQVRDSWHDGQIIDVPGEMLSLTSGILMAAMFSSTLPAPVLQRALGEMNTISHGLLRQTVTPPALNRVPTAANRRYRQAQRSLRALLDTAITGHAAAGGTDLMSALLAARDRDTVTEPGLTTEEVRDELVTFFIAGTETTGLTIAWALHLLAHHPAIASRLRTEVDDTLAGGAAHHRHLPHLPLAQRIITETLRLYPPGWIFTRRTTADTRLAGHLLPAGTTVVYSPYLVHHLADQYPDPEHFVPDRWADPDRSPPHGAYIPFGGGARKCVGEQFGVTEAVLALATLTARWHFTPAPGHPARPRTHLMLYPDGLRLKVTRRTA
ncbi:cytochrome P450 [Streptomyces achromogenes]|uniref:cytochrome P450 n=1 Tax=Streptomyces achromogenes TaxID=67255 RepID=UPI0036AC614D